ncbi:MULTISPECIES: thymidylate synthase [Psychrilyobacter]|uniref:Thymidylate synthase n=1 Tax=Psychrilyobacter piezotolerans TaxID=2293438 RepID=A0ABX9KJH1_9FUSO|nr:MULTISPECIES: thymidylate synthase [Psychrilyobacter]MCS5421807.1 thymidylate synthase [Psychrilyobacter sp. S5]NDI77039.1 thymidylate synthase [Psychrilyobacter piezotolerans]RDE64656.1 thymidylate synthase [Psychrilyobacter sp. S5]REI42468.1 thymidylate synthase [Psychrilyobacter piezotolerans]
MNYSDKLFIQEAKDILAGATNDGLDGVRPVWADGTTANTVAKFASITRYDLSKGLPITTLRRQYWKGAIQELIWIWVKNSNNIKDLPLKIWDSWADENGSIGKAYGYQLGKKIDFPEGNMTQVERVIYLLKNKPGDRRMVVTIWNNEDMKDMGLVPCAHTITFSVIGGKLNAVLDQRSGDFLAASGPGGYNEIQYATLVYMMAHIAGLEAGEFVHLTVNHHIYDRHIDYVKEMIAIGEEFDTESELPKLIIKNKVENFFDFTIDDFELAGYEPKSKSNKIEIAI